MSCVIDFVVAIVSILILKYFWGTMYADSKQQYLYMLNYAVLANVISIVYGINATNSLIGKIRTGDICVDLVRPWNVIVSLFFEDVGANTSRFLINGTPVILISVVFFSVKINSLAAVLWLVISVFLSSIILFLVKVCVSMICFWVVEAWSLTLLIDTVVLVLSGKFIPGWLMPRCIENIMNCLPFIWTYQKPIEIYLKTKFNFFSFECLSGMAMQVIWIVILTVMITLVWNRAIRKVTIQGG